ncbi:MAG: beta-ketoacyl-ACP synthase III [Alphaproteobacteria bacterium]
MTQRARVIGCGGYLPSQIVTNDMLSETLDTSNEWIVKRTGILQRHIAADGQLTSDLAVAAAQEAIKKAGIQPTEIDAIILATTTPDDTFPATALTVQRKLGADRAFAFDMQAVCAGFIYALATADSFIKSGQAKTVLVIGAEVMSRILDWQDRKTCILFGDGAGALILQAQDTTDDKAARGILSTHLYADGCHRDLLYVDGGAGRGGAVGVVRMEGREIFRHAVEKLGAAVVDSLKANNLTADDIQWFVPHQANLRIIESMSERFCIAPEKVILSVAEHANTSAASIPLAFAVADGADKFRPGDLIMSVAFGGGLTWGSALLRWYRGYFGNYGNCDKKVFSGRILGVLSVVKSISTYSAS